jgi:thiol-disulfide isomerase/thioredoxin
MRARLLLLSSVVFSLAHGVRVENKKPQQNDQNAAPTRSQIPAVQPQGVKYAQEKQKPVELTARNFGRMIGDNASTIWLIEFYGPNCIHCREFASTYDEIAAAYHSPNHQQQNQRNTNSNKKRIKVGVINGDMERALSSRFNIYAYPSFYLVDGWHVYEFNSASVRTKRSLMAFAEGGYKEQDPIPFYQSPMGPMGLMQGTLVSMGVVLLDIFEWTETASGLSTVMTACLLFGSLFMGSFFTIVFFAITITPKVKCD